MTWIAPSLNRTSAPRPAGERESLDGWLEYHRATLLLKCSGLDPDQLSQTPIASSSLSLLGLVRHLTEVERIWFRYRFAGQEVEPLYYLDENQDGAFDGVDPEHAEADFARYAAELDEARAAVAGRPLDETFTYGRRGIECDLRWVYVHMIEEYARHNGHADLLRELVDGTIGQ